MNKTIKFIAFYDSPENEQQQREVPPAAYHKMQSVLRSLQALGYRVEIISMSSTSGHENVRARRYLSEEGILIQLFASYGMGSQLHRVLNHVSIRRQMLCYLLRDLKAEDTVFVYHSMQYYWLVMLLKKLKGFRLILEMEEIYADVTGNPSWKARELRLARMADGFLFPTQLLSEAVNPTGKPFAVIHGTYRVEPPRDTSFGDGKIHVVYAGTLDPRKGGSTVAVQAAAFLPETYRLHILGFGSPEEVAFVQAQVDAVNGPGHAAVSFDGRLSGEEYVRFLQKCSIGLSTQNPHASFNDTSFPSKILSYMANGLRVVSIRIPAVTGSAVSDLITYYEEQTPEKVAEAILGVDLCAPYDSRERIQKLDQQFQAELQHLLTQLSAD